MMTREDYAREVATYSRRFMLQLLRRMGFACARLTDEQLREALRQLRDCRERGVRPSFDLRTH